MTAPDPAIDVDRILDRLRRYVEHESPSGNAARLDALAAVLAADLAGAGADVRQLDRGAAGHHVEARIAGADPTLEPLVLLGHFDTVHPVGTLARRAFVVRDGRVEGPGTFDMKAGLAVIVEALLRLREAGARPRRPVLVLASCDEEVGSDASREWLERAAAGAAAALVLEPSLPGGAAKTRRKGVAVYRLVCHGRAAHAGVDPEKGVSAIAELAHQLPRVLALADPERGTTINVGTIRGGSAVNVVAAEASAAIDVRCWTRSEADRIRLALGALRPVQADARVALVPSGDRPPLERTAAVASLYERARRAAAEVGFELGEGGTGGGSDGSFLAALGVPTLDGLGPDGGGAHAADEHVLLADLPRRVALLQLLVETL